MSTNKQILVLTAIFGMLFFAYVRVLLDNEKLEQINQVLHANPCLGIEVHPAGNEPRPPRFFPAGECTTSDHGKTITCTTGNSLSVQPGDTVEVYIGEPK